MHGLLNLHKPGGVTSRDVVNQVQRLVRPAKVGHAGTLDPLATGVLVVCVGAATRLIEYVQRLPKTYQATFLLGRRSDTDDIDGHVEELPASEPPPRAVIESLLPQFQGEIAQRPPDYSAVKIAGQRAYRLARRGAPVTLAERPVSIYSLHLRRYAYPELELDVECGSGTYIRALGRDLAVQLGTGAVMSRLVRSAIGSFRLADAVDPAALTLTKLQSQLLPVAMAVQALPAIHVSASDADRLTRGLRIPCPETFAASEGAAIDPSGRLVAVVVCREQQLRPEKVLATG